MDTIYEIMKAIDAVQEGAVESVVIYCCPDEKETVEGALSNAGLWFDFTVVGVPYLARGQAAVTVNRFGDKLTLPRRVVH